jgi:hypothetical protein
MKRASKFILVEIHELIQLAQIEHALNNIWQNGVVRTVLVASAQSDVAAASIIALIHAKLVAGAVLYTHVSFMGLAIMTLATICPHFFCNPSTNNKIN